MSRVLVIDDEKGIAAVIREALSLCGHEVQSACDGSDGIRKFISRRFDVVITDIMMPNIDGNGVVRFIRNSNWKTTPVIGMSGTPLLLSDSDFDTVLFKPFPLQALINAVDALASVSRCESGTLKACA